MKKRIDIESLERTVKMFKDNWGTGITGSTINREEDYCPYDITINSTKFEVKSITSPLYKNGSINIHYNGKNGFKDRNTGEKQVRYEDEPWTSWTPMDVYYYEKDNYYSKDHKYIEGLPKEVWDKDLVFINLDSPVSQVLENGKAFKLWDDNIGLVIETTDAWLIYKPDDLKISFACNAEVKPRDGHTKHFNNHAKVWERKMFLDIAGATIIRK